jgi:5'-3' exonuclease
MRNNNTSNPPTFLFIDGSYYCFYRYYSMMTWWRYTNTEEAELKVLEDPYNNPEFVEKFKKTFVEKLQQIPKMLGIHEQNPTIIVGKDCKRETIWRTKLFPGYKANRVKDDLFMGGPFFKMVYEENLFDKAFQPALLEKEKKTEKMKKFHIVQYPELEADDCIAISVKCLLNKYPSCNIYIITSDKDYLQLVRENVKVFNLAFKNIAENKSSTGNYAEDLAIKIIMGDVSDNIPSIFPKCGPKTAKKCLECPEFLQNKLKNPEYLKQYELNKILVDFDNIPQNLVSEFLYTVEFL